MCSNNKHKNQKHREYYAGTIAAVDDDEVEETRMHTKNTTRATTKHHPHMIASRVAAACVNQISKTKNTEHVAPLPQHNNHNDVAIDD